MAGAVLLALLGLSGCAADGESCGLGRCKNGSKCVTVFAGGFESKAARPGTEVDNLYWCLGDCPKGKSCPGQCMENPIDDTVVTCSGKQVAMELHCPTTLGATVDGTCESFDVVSCVSGTTQCKAGMSCPLGTLSPGRVVGPIGVQVKQGDPLFLDTSALAHTTDANPPLADDLPAGQTVRINLPTSCD